MGKQKMTEGREREGRVGRVGKEAGAVTREPLINIKDNQICVREALKSMYANLGVLTLIFFLVALNITKIVTAENSIQTTIIRQKNNLILNTNGIAQSPRSVIAV